MEVEYGGEKQYHLIFTSKGKDTYLHRVKTENIYGSFSENSTESRWFAEELLTIYAQKVIAYATKEYRLFSWIPWEIISSEKPKPEQLSANGNAMMATLNTVSTQKFVYVYNSVNDAWVFCLSTNKVSYAVSATEALNINGRAVNETYESGTMWDYGNWDSAFTDANTMFHSGSNCSTCIEMLRIDSKSKQKIVLKQEIHSPKRVTQML